MVVQVAHCRGGRVGVGKLCKAEAFGPACFLVVDEAEVEDVSYAAERLDDKLFGPSCQELGFAVCYVHDTWEAKGLEAKR